MPPKKPALTAGRRTVVPGSHQILFSSPIERTGEQQRHDANRRSSSTAAAGNPRKTKRDKSVPRAADYSHVESKVKSQMGGDVAGRRKSSSGIGYPQTTTNSAFHADGGVRPAHHKRTLPHSPPPPPQQQHCTASAYASSSSQPKYEVITEAPECGGAGGYSAPYGDNGDDGSLSLHNSYGHPVPSHEGAAEAVDMPPRGGASERLSAARVTRLLKNARAAVQAPFRPETPLSLLRPTTDRAREEFLKGKPSPSSNLSLGRGPASGAGVRRSRYGLPGSGNTHRPAGQRLASLSPSPPSPLPLQTVAATGNSITETAASSFSHTHDALGSPLETDSLPQQQLSAFAPPALGGAAPFVFPALTLLLSSSGSTSGVGTTSTIPSSPPSDALSPPPLSPESFLASFMRAEGQPRQQLSLLRSLARWLAVPQNAIWPAWAEYFTKFLSLCNSISSPGERAVSLAESETMVVGAVLTSLLLRRSNVASDASSRGAADGGVPLAEMVLLLRRLTAAPWHFLCASSTPSGAAAAEGRRRTNLTPQQESVISCRVVEWLERELLAEPLLQLLNADALLNQQPHVIADALEVLRNCTKATALESAGERNGGDGKHDANSRHSSLSGSNSGLQDGQTQRQNTSSSRADGAAISLHLVTLGVIPTLGAFTQRALSLYKALPPSLPQSGLPDSSKETSAFLPHLLSSVCLLYRDLSGDFSHHLLKLGTLPILLAVLEGACSPTASTDASTGILASVARALAKLIFDPAWLTEFQKDTRLMKASLTALAAQLALHQGQCERGARGSQSQDGGRRLSDSVRSRAEEQETLFHLLVSRLCNVMAQVAEGCERQQRYLVRHGTDVELTLLRRFVTPAALSLPASGGTPGEDHVPASALERAAAEVGEGAEAQGGSGSLTMIQGIVWLVGVTAMGEEGLPLPYVEEAATQLTLFLKDVARDHDTRLVVVYALMCLSNLSYYFPAIERQSDSGIIYLEELYTSLGLVLASVLVDGDVEATVEATRTLGNMSFTNTGRDWMESSKCDEVVLLFLGHEDLRVVYNSFGIVLNLTASTSCRIAEDAELLKMLLQYTGRFTHRKGIDEAAREGQRRFEMVVSSDATKGVAQDYAEQIADLVEKCLANLRGLLFSQQQQESQASGAADDI